MMNMIHTCDQPVSREGMTAEALAAAATTGGGGNAVPERGNLGDESDRSTAGQCNGVITSIAEEMKLQLKPS